jgi:hypothetical protein
LTRDEFSKSIRQLPPEWIDEIHECVLDANPSWAKEGEVIKEIYECRIQTLGSLFMLYSKIQGYEPDAEVDITVKVRINDDEIMFNVQQ